MDVEENSRHKKTPDLSSWPRRRPSSRLSVSGGSGDQGQVPCGRVWALLCQFRDALIFISALYLQLVLRYSPPGVGLAILWCDRTRCYPARVDVRTASSSISSGLRVAAMPANCATPLASPGLEEGAEQQLVVVVAVDRSPISATRRSDPPRAKPGTLRMRRHPPERRVRREAPAPVPPGTWARWSRPLGLTRPHAELLSPRCAEPTSGLPPDASIAEALEAHCARVTSIPSTRRAKLRSTS